MQVIDNDTPGTVEELTLSDNQATTSLSLYASHRYTFLFWADDGSYTATSLTNITLNSGLTGTQAGLSYATSKDWDGTSTLSATLTHVASKVTLKATNELEAGNALTLTVPQAYSGYNVQTATTTGTPAEYEHSVTTTAVSGTEEQPVELFSFYVLAADALQNLTVSCNNETATVPANLSGGKHIILKGDISTREQPITSNITVTVGDWSGQELPFGGKDVLTDDTRASTSLQGAGTATDPYRITSAADLKCYMSSLTYRSSSSHALLYTDIEITATSDWDPTSLSGTFDGGGHTISGTLNFSVADTDYYIGLFGNVYGTVRNLNVEADITAEGSTTDNYCYAGGIATYCQGGTIEHCTYSGKATVQVSVTGEAMGLRAGGIVGYAQSATVSYCKFSGTLDTTGSSVGDGSMYVGGIAGYKLGGTFTENDCSEGNPSTPAVGYE